MTLPFTAPFEASLKLPLQGGLLRLQEGAIVAPQFHCCISGTSVGVAKNPVAVLAGIQELCVGQPFTVDFSLSWSPSDTLAGQAYTITWGDGSPNTNGNFPNPRNPAGETETKAAGYAAVGVYTVSIEVDDSTGANDFDEFQVAVIDCSAAVYSHPIWYSTGMMMTSDDEFYYTWNLTAAFPTWTAFSGGYPGTEIHDAMTELESDGNEYIYGADVLGIFSHEMPPNVGVWTTLVSSDDMVDAAGLTSGNYTCHAMRLAISYVNDGWQWCSWQATNPVLGTEDYHVGVAHTRDGWQTIHHSSIVVTIAYDAAKTQSIEAHGVDIVQQVSGRYVYCAVKWQEDVIGANEDARLYRSADFGVTWALVDSGRTVGSCDVWVPNSGYGGTVWFGCIDQLYKSTNNGLSFGAAGALSGITGTLRIAGPIDDTTIVTAINDDELWEKINTGAMRHMTPDMPASDPAQGFLSLTRDGSKNSTEVFWVGGAYLATSRIKINDWPAAQNNKEGGYADHDPSNVVLPELREYS
jgi:hypothetical protein